MFVINSKTFKEQKSFQLNKAIEILEQDEFDNAKPTVIYIHGYVETMEVESVKVITDAYLARGDHSEFNFATIFNHFWSNFFLFLDIIILDWGELADGSYLLDAVPNAVKVIVYFKTFWLDF